VSANPTPIAALSTPGLRRDLVGTVHLRGDVLGDGLVQRRLCRRQRVLDRPRDAFGEQGCPVEPQELLLDHATHEVADLGGAEAVAGGSGEPVGVQQRHEELEVLVLAVVGGGGHQQQVAGAGTEPFTELVQLGLADLPTPDVGRQPVRLVDHDQIPRLAHRTVLQLLVAGQLVETGDPSVPLDEGVTGAGIVHVRAGQHVERETELLGELVLPLLGERAGSHHQAPLHVPAQHELLDEESCHDGLAGTRIVREQEPERLTGQHLLVHRTDLVRKRLDRRREDRLHRIEQVGQADALGLRGESEEMAVGGEREIR
jgi:hypothetical protein